MNRSRITAVAILLWNLIGDAAYLAQVTADPAKLAASDPVTAQAFAAMPTWAWAAYAIAVWLGTAGAVALLLGRRIATVLFALSVAGVVAQFGWSFLVFGLIARKGAATALFPLVIFAVGLAQLAYARLKARQGMLR